MSSNYSTIQQHEPLRVPAGWGTQEKRFIAQLEETFDDIYRRFGRLRLEDMSDSLQKEFKGVNELGEELATEITARENGINVLTTKTGINNLGQNETLFSRLQTDEQSYALTFQKIGASGYTATGITTIGENGITVTHSGVTGKTVMSADGFKIYNGANQQIGGIVNIGGSVKMACSTLVNLSYPNHTVDIGWVPGFAQRPVYGSAYRYGSGIVGVAGTQMSEGSVSGFGIASNTYPIIIGSDAYGINIMSATEVYIAGGTDPRDASIQLIDGDIWFQWTSSGGSIVRTDIRYIYNHLVGQG